ncbi:hypothetical protein [Desulforamulus ruminis]|uniref:Uncharacterized protein n=1 Tax=Desulforamulus ruminis (strain ATCC 23193 / DSM 2154 / NCIMB 8452 / DL) TaxID=696281 RepID=F6DQI4_DESRL|nr:hypothetical protein [Desulforamulus ruminis]AEG60878.1 hypothetical protein Desru_2652 [Desulforamulus ruminis DSM 2154]
MWVYWFALILITLILYFPFKKIFSKDTAAAISLSALGLGSLFPLFRFYFPAEQTYALGAILVLALGICIALGKSRCAPQDQDSPEPEPALAVYDTTASTELPGITPAEWIALSSPEARSKDPDPPKLSAQAPEEQNPPKDDSLWEPVPAKDENRPVSPVMPEGSEADSCQPEETDLEPAVSSAKPADQEFFSPAELMESAPEVIAAVEVERDAVEGQKQEQAPEASEPETPEKIILEDPRVEDLRTTNSEETVFPEHPLPEADPLNAAEPVFPTAQAMAAEGLRLARQKDYVGAVRQLNRVLAKNPKPEVLYLAVSELSSIYQHLGLYPMASDIIAAFVGHPDLSGHPGLSHLKQKRKFILALINVLKHAGLGQLPYQEVPEKVRREAFRSSLK